MSCVFYLRGLNTYADDRIRLGPVRAGLMHQPMQDALESHGVIFRPVLGMKTGPIKKVAERAKNFLKQDSLWQSQQKLHLIGHSTGGLIARLLLHDPEIAERVDSLLSIGTPHLGAQAADRALILGSKNRFVFKSLSLVGYEWQARREIFNDLSPASIKRFNKEFPDILGVRYACHLCSIPTDQQSLVMKAINKVIPTQEEGDGLISLSSQHRGEVLGHFQLDHFTQLGYFPFLKKELKKNHQTEFLRMIKTTVDFWDSI